MTNKLFCSLGARIPTLLEGEENITNNPNSYETRRHGLAKSRVIIVPYSDIYNGSWQDESGKFRRETQAIHFDDRINHPSRDFYAVRWAKITKEDRDAEVQALEKKLAQLKENQWRK